MKLAITNLISNKRAWNNCFIKFLKLQKFGSTKYKRKKARTSEQNRLMRCCVIPCGQTDVGSSQNISCLFASLFKCGAYSRVALI